MLSFCRYRVPYENNELISITKQSSVGDISMKNILSISAARNCKLSIHWNKDAVHGFNILYLILLCIIYDIFHFILYHFFYFFYFFYLVSFLLFLLFIPFIWLYFIHLFHFTLFIYNDVRKVFSIYICQIIYFCGIEMIYECNFVYTESHWTSDNDFVLFVKQRLLSQK